jgi:histidinol-phosphate aminotransferase
MPDRISRRRFAGLLGAGAAAAVLRPAAALAPRQAQAAAAAPAAAPAIEPSRVGGLVRLSANENPYGPPPAALTALRDSGALAWRYPDEHLDELVAAIAKLHSVGTDHLLFGAGSSEILRLCAAAATGPARALVIADPTFEALIRGAKTAGAEVVKVPLTADFRHDLPQMLQARKPAGLIYVCNPNNPTGSVTPKGEVRAFLSQVPGETMVLVDEAYFHFAGGPDYESVIPLVAEHPNLVVARTFSKIYGMAGLRCGYAVAQPQTIERLTAHQAFDSMSIAAIVAARAGLTDTEHLARSGRLIAEARKSTTAALEKLGHPVIPSSTNFFMVDLKRDVRPVIAALKAHGVEVGRFFPALPNHLRVTVGTAPQMESFLGAFRQVVT